MGGGDFGGLSRYKVCFQVVFVLFAFSSDLPGQLVIDAALFLVWYMYMYYIYASLGHALHCILVHVHVLIYICKSWPCITL